MKSKVSKQVPKNEPMEVDEVIKKPKKKPSKAALKVEKPNHPETAKQSIKGKVKADNVVVSPKAQPNQPKKSAKKPKLETSSVEKTASPEKKPSLPTKEKEQRNERTVFIGNLPNSATPKQLKSMFNKFGPIEKAWIRGAKPGNEKITKKLAYVKKLFHKDLISLIGFVAFKTVEDANKALALNGSKIENRVIRVTLSTQKDYDSNKGIFVGNLPYNITDEELRSTFNECGDILGVRIIRSKATGLGKGFGYVNFKSADAVELAMKLDNTEVSERPIRVERLLNEGKKKKIMKKKALVKNVQGKTEKKINFEKKKDKKKPTSSPVTKSSPAKPKKKKVSPLEKKKKVLAEKLQANPKKKKQ